MNTNIWARLFANNPGKDSPSFEHSLRSELLSRLNLSSLTVVVLAAFQFYADYRLLSGSAPPAFSRQLFLIHASGLLLSIGYLLAYRLMKRKLHFIDSVWSSVLIHGYIAMYLLSGALASINSQSLNGNVDAYAIILIAVAVMFPVRPKIFLPLAAANHLFFLAALQTVNTNPYYLISKQINTTGTLGIACLIVITYYNYRKTHFHHKIMLKESESNFRNLFEVNPYPLVLTRLEDGQILLFNEKALEFYEISREQVRQITAISFYKNPRERAQIIEELVRTGSMKNYITEHQTSSGSYRWVMIQFQLIDYEGETCILSGITDISELKKMEEELTRHATMDALTGALNRRSGMEMLQRELDRAKSEDIRFVVCFIDINNLKEVNDSFGHAEGDAMIKQVSEVLAASKGEQDALFRLGGDEFIMLFRNKRLADAQAAWQRIEEDFRRLNSKQNKPFTISVSHGFSEFHSGMSVSAADMIERADHEMYREKLSSK